MTLSTNNSVLVKYVSICLTACMFAFVHVFLFICVCVCACVCWLCGRPGHSVEDGEYKTRPLSEPWQRRVNNLLTIDTMSRELTSTACGMDSIVFDVWVEHVLPLLSIRDIFRLCGTSRQVPSLLFWEDTFRHLCRVSSLFT